MQTLNFHGTVGNGIPVIVVDNATWLQFGTTVPTDATAGFAKGALFVQTDGSAGSVLYVNEGTVASCDFNPVASGGTSVSLEDGSNLVLGTTTGSKIGTAATQKLGFWNATPAVQPSGASQAALTDSSGGTADGTVSAVGATNSGDVSGTINNNFKEVVTLLNAIRSALVTVGIIKGAA
jgi:hypothetical protein